MESSNIDTDILYVKVYIIHIDIYSDIMTWLSSGGKANWFLCRTSISMRPTLELFWWKRGNMPLYKNEKSQIQSTVNIAFTILVLLYLALGLHYGTKRCSGEEMIKPIFFPPLLSGHFNVNLDIEINRQLTTEAWRIFKDQRFHPHWPGSIGEDQHPAAVEEAVLELPGVARPIAEGQLTQAVTQTCSRKTAFSFASFHSSQTTAQLAAHQHSSFVSLLYEKEPLAALMETTDFCVYCILKRVNETSTATMWSSELTITERNHGNLTGLFGLLVCSCGLMKRRNKYPVPVLRKA